MTFSCFVFYNVIVFHAVCLLGEKQNTKETMLPSLLSSNPSMSALTIHTLPALERFSITQMCFNEPWCFGGFPPDHKQNILNGLHSAQKHMAFSEVFILKKSVLRKIYNHGYDMGYKLFWA